MGTPNKKDKYMGMRKQMNCGEWATIIDYVNSMNITVKFDNGDIREHIPISRFKSGSVANKKAYIGMRNQMNCGDWCTIIDYVNNNDITVKFDTGEIREHISVSSFKDGSVAKFLRNAYKFRVGETRTMNCGMCAKIIRYTSSKDLDVQFQNGVIKKTSYSDFSRGAVSSIVKTDIGVTKLMNCGLSCTVIELLRSEHSLIVQFETGMIQKVTSNLFNRGCVLLKSSKFSYAARPVFRLEDPREVYYKCTCKNCGEQFISRLIDLKSHICIEKE